MTIKSRNRFVIISFLITIVILLIYALLFSYCYFLDSISFPQVKIDSNNSNSFLFSYSPYAVIISCFVEIFFACFIFRTIFKHFGKTKSSNIFFFLIFTISVVIDSTRIFIPLLNIAGIFSKPLFVIGNATIFSKILGLLSLFLVNYESSDGTFQNNDMSSIIIIVIALFFSIFIPLNTTTILPNYTVSHAYYNLLKSTFFIIIILNSIVMYFSNQSKEFSQYTTIFFTTMSFGYYYLIYSTTYFSLIFSSFALAFGSYFYLRELHNQYMLYD